MSEHNPNKITIRMELEFTRGNQYSTPINKGIKIQGVGYVRVSPSQFMQLYMDYETGTLYGHDGTYWYDCNQFQHKRQTQAERKSERRGKRKDTGVGPDYGID